MEAELGCCSKILDYLSKQSYSDEMVYPKDPHPRDPHKKLYLKAFGERKQSEVVPVKKYSDQSFTPNDSLYVRVVQKIQADAKDKT